MKDVPTTYLQLAVLTGRSVILPASSICLQLGGQKVRPFVLRSTDWQSACVCIRVEAVIAVRKFGHVLLQHV